MASHEVKIASNSETSIEALLAVSTVGRLEIVDSEALTDSLTIPSTIDLVANGGVITPAPQVASEILYVEANMKGVKQRLFNDDSLAGRIAFKYQTAIPLMAFGLDQNASASVNLAAFKTAFVNCRTWGSGHSGGIMEIPSGYFDVAKFDAQTVTGVWSDAGSTAGVHNIQGAGKRKTNLRTAVNTNETGWSFRSLFESRIADLAFTAESQSAWPSDEPLVHVYFGYNNYFESLFIKNPHGDGIKIEEGQQYTFLHCEAELCEGWNWTLQGVHSTTHIGSSAEQANGSGQGGFRLLPGTSGDPAGSDFRTHQTSHVFINPYMEDTTTGMHVESGGNVIIGGYHDGPAITDAFVFTNGANQNLVFAGGINTRVTLEDTSFLNEFRPNIQTSDGEILDPGECNDITPIAPNALAWEPRQGFTGACFSNNTNPVTADTGGGTKTVGTCELIPEAAAYDSTFGNVGHMKRTGNGVVHKQVASGLTTGNTYYVYILAQRDAGAHGRLSLILQQHNVARYFSWQTQQFQTNSSSLALPIVPGKLGLFRVKFVHTGATVTDANVELSINASWCTTQVHRVFYCCVSSEPNLRMEHIRGGSNVGHGDHIEYTDATRPAASNFSRGVKIWNTDDNAYNYSNGTNWYDSTGTTT